MEQDIEIPGSLAEQLLTLAAEKEVSVEEIVESALKKLLQKGSDEIVR